MMARRVASLLGRWAGDLLQSVVFAVLPKLPRRRWLHETACLPFLD